MWSARIFEPHPAIDLPAPAATGVVGPLLKRPEGQLGRPAALPARVTSIHCGAIGGVVQLGDRALNAAFLYSNAHIEEERFGRTQDYV